MVLNTSVRKIVIAIGIDTAVTLLAIPLWNTIAYGKWGGRQKRGEEGNYKGIQREKHALNRELARKNEKKMKCE